MPFEFRRLNHRMHNKLFVVDGFATIIGGRNVGGHYFEAHEETNFTDLDVLLLGPVAQAAQQCFETYWTSELAVPLQDAMGKRDARISRERLERYVRPARFTRLQDIYRQEYGGLRETLQDGRHTVHWAGTRVVADDPRKASARRARHVPQVMIDTLTETWDQAREEVRAATPYFVPGRKGVADLLRLRRRGVDVRILTNSLASNDVPAVHGGYSRYRRTLLRAGVGLYEYQRFGNRPRRHHKASRSNALHAKTIVVDRRLAWIGLARDHRRDVAQQHAAVRARPLRLGVGEVHADVAQRQRAEDRVGDRVQKDVGVGVPGQPAVERNRHAADHQAPPGGERVHVEAVADADRHRSSPSPAWAARIAAASARSSGHVTLRFAGLPGTSRGRWPSRSTACASSVAVSAWSSASACASTR